MINKFEVIETNKMIDDYNLDVRTITLGISLMDCISNDLETLNNNIYNKIKKLAGNLVQTGEDISKEYGIPIVKKRIWSSDCKQTNFRYTNWFSWGKCL